MSKIVISKAIHNPPDTPPSSLRVVINVSKVKISKAIHNAGFRAVILTVVVINVSKIVISKAIHNGEYTPFLALLGGLTEQYVHEEMKRCIEQGQMTGYPLYAIQ